MPLHTHCWELFTLLACLPAHNVAQTCEVFQGPSVTFFSPGALSLSSEMGCWMCPLLDEAAAKRNALSSTNLIKWVLLNCPWEMAGFVKIICNMQLCKQNFTCSFYTVIQWQLLSFCFSQKENIRQKFVADLQKEFAGKGLTFSIGMLYPAVFQTFCLSPSSWSRAPTLLRLDSAQCSVNRQRMWVMQSVWGASYFLLHNQHCAGFAYQPGNGFPTVVSVFSFLFLFFFPQYWGLNVGPLAC